MKLVENTIIQSVSISLQWCCSAYEGLTDVRRCVTPVNSYITCELQNCSFTTAQRRHCSNEFTKQNLCAGVFQKDRF